MSVRAIAAPAAFALAALAGAWLIGGSIVFNTATPVEIVPHPRAREAAVILWLATLACASFGTAGALRRSPRVLVASALAAVAAVWLWPIVFSADLHAYAAYGAIVLHGGNPYAGTIVRANNDPIVTAALQAWSGSIPADVYGPLFTALAALCARTGSALAALQLSAAAAFALCLWLVRRDRPRLALIATHPVLLWSVGEGHNDALMLALVLAAQQRRRFAAATTLFIAAIGVKIVALLPALWRMRGPAQTIALLAGTAAVCTPLLLRTSSASPTVALRFSLIGVIAAARSWPPGLVIIAAGMGVAAAGLLIARRRDGLAAAALGAWFLLPAAYPWYALWSVPLAGMVRPSPSRVGLLVASYASIIAVLPDALFGAGWNATTVAHQPLFFGGTLILNYAPPLVVLALLAGVSTAAVAQQPAPPPPAASSPVAATPSPIASSPAPTGNPSPASQFGYVINPPVAASPAPRIVQVSINDRTLHSGGAVLVRVATSDDVTGVFAQAFGQSVAIPNSGRGIFSLSTTIPGGAPFFMLNRDYTIAIVATTQDGRSTTVGVPIHFAR